jgi:hypothetical protein
MKATIIKIVFASFFSNFLFAQKYYNNLTYRPHAFTVLPLNNGEVLMGGGTYYPTNKEMIITKFNDKGDTLWNRIFFIEPSVCVAHKILQKDSLYFYTLSNYYDSANTQSDIMLSMHNISDGDTLWTKRYRYSNFEGINDAILLNNGNILAVGHTYSFGNNSQGFLICVDSMGNLLWKKTFGGGGYEWLYSIDIDVSGNIIMGGFYESNTTFETAGYVVKTDNQGNLLWQKYYGDTNNKQDNTAFVKVLNDGNLLMAASEGYNIVSYKMKGYVAKLNTSNGNIMWKKNYLDSTIFYKNPVLNADGSFIISGTISTFDVITGNSNIRARIVKFTATGDTIWSRTYRTKPDRDCYFYDIQATPDSGYVMCGFGFDSTNTQRAWIVKTDCMGADSITYYFPDEVCTTTGWVTAITPEEPINQSLLNTHKINLYPNPTNGLVTVVTSESGNLQIYNSIGVLVKEVYLPRHAEASKQEHEINISDFPSGVYLFRVGNESIKLIKE